MAYSIEQNAQIIASVLKQHGIRYVIASPGSTNQPLVITFQNDPFFKVFSCVDERSAAYIACGLAATSGEPVVLSCTGATSSRNYMPGLTEAYYRKLPLIALTSFNGNRNIGQLVPQNLDRRVVPNDLVLKSVQIPIVKDQDDAKYCTRIANDAILEATRHGGGPVHLNIETSYTPDIVEGEFPHFRIIRRYSYEDTFPRLDQNSRISIFIGAHRPFSSRTKSAIESFVNRYNTVVFVDHTSNYTGEGAFFSTLATDNTKTSDSRLKPDLIISLGEVSGDYPTANYLSATHSPTWRVSEDGEIRDRFNTLTAVFECSEAFFFERYAKMAEKDIQISSFYSSWIHQDSILRRRIPELPYSGRWLAQQTAGLIPANSIVHFAILNALRGWNYFKMDDSVRCFCNTGGFGIDGAMSTLFGSALAEPQTLHYLIIGDLAFFYDMNVLGNRDLMKNIRIMLVNNGLGDEMRMSYAVASNLKGAELPYICASGHFKSSAELSAAGAWATALGIEYRQAQNKTEYLEELRHFVDPAVDGPIILECFTDPNEDKEAGKLLTELNPEIVKEKRIKNAVKTIMPKKVIKKIKTIIGK